MSVTDALISRFRESHEEITAHTDAITHLESIQSPVAGHNSMHWIVGHIVVARCNFLVFFDVPSIWDWPTCEHFIPGSAPSAAAAEHIAFSTLRADLDRTQDFLVAALKRVTAEDLDAIQDGQTIGDHLAMYVAHEAHHAGQLETLRRALRND